MFLVAYEHRWPRAVRRCAAAQPCSAGSCAARLRSHVSDHLAFQHAVDMAKIIAQTSPDAGRADQVPV
jgi:hypothetical protein